MQENTVCLSISSYNQIKAENTRFNMFMQRIMESGTLSSDKSSIEFNTKLLSDVIQIIYPEAYKKKLSHLRRADTVEAMKSLKEEN